MYFSDCWVIIDNRVYDVTQFLPVRNTVFKLYLVVLLTDVFQLHPGGKQIILKYAGKDATAAYKPIHPEDALEKNLPKGKHLGYVDENAVREIHRADANRKQTKDELRVEQAKGSKPPLKRILSLQDIEVRFGTCQPTAE